MKKKLQKRQIFRFFSALLCLVLVLVLTCVSNMLSGLLYSQQAGERWQGDSDTRFAQISVFFRQDSDFTINHIDSLHESIESYLTSASLEASSDSARLWYDCYSTQGGQISITGTRKNSAKALVTAVGGDFFTMHTPELADGSYFQDSDIMQDRVVIDTTLAWQLFGSSQVAGMELKINQKTCLISGVIKPETDYASKTAYGDTPRIYMSYVLYQELNILDSNIQIDCYESVLPN
ncbi:MAG: ABC transporter permease, partial [Oscillospiraceae bacterium]|nr:ABC transporter permease [Oscillospiraceae bacterium]